jgi:hypothetical protein
LEAKALMPVSLDLSAGDGNCVAGDGQRDAMKIAGRRLYFFELIFIFNRLMAILFSFLEDP